MNIKKKTLFKVFLVVAACIILYWLLHETDRVRSVWTVVKNIFSPFFIGAGLAFILNVPMRGIEGILKFVKQPTLRRVIALVLTLIAILLVLLLVVQLLLPQLTATVESLVAKLPGFFNRAMETVQKFLNDNPDVMKWVNENTDLETVDWSALVNKVVDFAGERVSAIISGTFSAIGSLSSGIFNAVISLVFALYCLFRKEILARQARRILYAFVPEHASDEIVRIMRLTSATFANFISGQFLEACILGCLFAIAMLIFRMPYVALVSVLVGVTALVPIVGAFVGCILGAFFILVDNPIQAVWFVVMFLVIQQIEGNLIYPRVVGKSVGLPGMWVLFAVSLGGELMGIAGMFIMIPVASVLYTLLGEITNKRLEDRSIDADKLQDHPPETRARLVNKRKREKKLMKLRESKRSTEK